MTFKEKVVKLRKMKGLTQDEFASAVGVSRQAVYKWESGQSYPEAAKLLEMKLLFNISIDDLLDENYEVVVPEKKKRKRLPKAVEKEIENAVKEETLPAEETIPAQEVKEEVTVAAETTAAEEIKEEVPAAEVVAEPTAFEEKEPEKEDAKPAQPEKKVGFFGRLFGRR